MSDELTCAELQPLLRDAARGRLDANLTRVVAAHLAGCAACRAISDEERALDQRLDELPQHPASLALKRRLVARLPPVSGPSRRARTLRWSALTLPLAACVALWLGLRPRLDPVAPLVTEAVNDHLRVVFRDRPVDIESGGPHQVKPWFTGRLDFAIPQVYAGDDEYTLMGGAVGFFRDRKAAQLIYKRQLHTISLFVFPGDGLALPPGAAVHRERGFAVILWREGDLGYALVSDLNGADLQTLAQRLAAPR